MLADSERKVILYWRFLENVEYSCWSWVEIWEVVRGMMQIVEMTESDREELVLERAIKEEHLTVEVIEIETIDTTGLSTAKMS